jgi:type IV pilus assembly protein PilC
VYRNLLLGIADQVQKGIPMSVPLMEHKEFHPIVSQMVAVGEQTGKLDEIMASLARFFDDECTKRISIATALLEPILLVFIGLGVGVIVFSIIMPIYQISGGIK